MPFDTFFDQNNLFLQTEHYLLCRISPSEKPCYARLAEKETPDFLRNSGISSAPSWDDLLSAEHLTCSILKKETGTFCGFCQLQWIFSAAPELGIDLLPEYQKQGIATEVLPPFLSRAKKLLPNSCFHAKIQKQNHPSQRLAEKIGGICIGEKSLLSADFPTAWIAFAEQEFPNLFYLEYHFPIEEK